MGMAIIILLNKTPFQWTLIVLSRKFLTLIGSPMDYYLLIDQFCLHEGDERSLIQKLKYV